MDFTRAMPKLIVYDKLAGTSESTDPKSRHGLKSPIMAKCLSGQELM